MHVFVSLSESCAKHVAKKQSQQSQLSQRDRATLNVCVTTDKDCLPNYHRRLPVIVDAAQLYKKLNFNTFAVGKMTSTVAEGRRKLHCLRYHISHYHFLLTPVVIVSLFCIISAILPILECGPMPNLMVALLNIGGALCSTPQSLADAHY